MLRPSPTPATRENPRHVTQEDIDAFELRNPALVGIGAIMVDMGIWRLTESQPARGCA